MDTEIFIWLNCHMSQNLILLTLEPYEKVKIILSSRDVKSRWQVGLAHELQFADLWIIREGHCIISLHTLIFLTLREPSGHREMLVPLEAQRYNVSLLCEAPGLAPHLTM